MAKALSVGQIWLLEEMVTGSGCVSTQTRTTSCPEPVGMAALRGLEKRGLCSEYLPGIFRINEAGRRHYTINKPTLDAAKAKKREAELAAAEEDDKVWRNNGSK
jgi:hypothetical protein